MTDNLQSPPGMSAAHMIDRALRVDHAGEHGAVRIYEGQLAVLRATGRHAQAVRLIEEMKAGEARHLATFDRLLVEHKIRPTLFSPFWHIAGFALGAASALVSEKAAMACTEAVETAIDDHYAEQSRQLAPIAPALTDTIDAFRADEAHHRETAIAHGATQAPLHGFLSKVIQAGCRAAIKLSERV